MGIQRAARTFDINILTCRVERYIVRRHPLRIIYIVTSAVQGDGCELLTHIHIVSRIADCEICVLRKTGELDRGAGAPTYSSALMLIGKVNDVTAIIDVDFCSVYRLHNFVPDYRAPEPVVPDPAPQQAQVDCLVPTRDQ